MPTHFAKFRFLNGERKKVENISYMNPLVVRVDGHPSFVVPPGDSVEIPDGEVIEVETEIDVP